MYVLMKGLKLLNGISNVDMFSFRDSFAFLSAASLPVINVSWNLLKSESSHINIDPKPYAKYQNPSSGGYQDFVLTSVFYCYYKWQRTITLVKSSHV